MANDYERAIAYVRKNKTWSNEDDERALRIINEYKCDIASADTHIAMEIYDLMEEWGDEHGYSEGWWLDYGTEDDVFMKL